MAFQERFKIPPALWAGWSRVAYLPFFPPGMGLPLPLPLPHDPQPYPSRRARPSVWCFFGCLLRFFFRIALRHRFGIDFWTILDPQHPPKSIQNRSKSYQLCVMMLYMLKVQFWTTSSVFWMVFAFATASKINENRIPNRLELVLLFWSLATSILYRFWIDFGSHFVDPPHPTGVASVSDY